MIAASIMMGLLLIAAVLRLLPQKMSQGALGVDHWFWKKYIETSRKTGVFPPRLSQYLLDEHQWYPPLFPLMMTKLPAFIFERFSHSLAIVIDLLRMLLLLTVTYFVTGGDLWVVCLAGLIYATTPILISYNIQLNPRGLAALFLDGLLVAILWFYSYHGPWWSWIIATFLGSLVLLTHKMTTQLFVFLSLCSFLVYWDFKLLLIVPASVCLALILSRGFYFKVLRAHADIVIFWYKNWRWVGADMVKESPLYGDQKYERPQKLHQTGIRGFFWHCFLLFGFNPASWVACLLVLERIFIVPHILIYSSWLMLWLLLPCLLAILTTFVSYLRCIGAGYLYLYNTSLITSLLLGVAYRYTKSSSIPATTYFVALILNILGMFLFFRKLRRDQRNQIDSSFEKILETLKDLPQGTVWCLPVHAWHEAVAYKTNHYVLWGAHGYGFKNLTPTFPRITEPLSKIISDFRVRYILSLENHFTPKFVAEMPSTINVYRESNYVLYDFGPDERIPKTHQ